MNTTATVSPYVKLPFTNVQPLLAVGSGLRYRYYSWSEPKIERFTNDDGAEVAFGLIEFTTRLEEDHRYYAEDHRYLGQKIVTRPRKGVKVNTFADDHGQHTITAVYTKDPETEMTSVEVFDSNDTLIVKEDFS